MSWNFNLEGLIPGHSWTLWVGNFDDPPVFINGGSAGGGLVGGSGQVTAAGNHCIWPLITDLDGGFRPGVAPDCSMIDVNKEISFFLMDHLEWTPGDVMAFWDPTGGEGNPPVYGGFVMGWFPPLED